MLEWIWFMLYNMQVVDTLEWIWFILHNMWVVDMLEWTVYTT